MLALRLAVGTACQRVQHPWQIMTPQWMIDKIMKSAYTGADGVAAAAPKAATTQTHKAKAKAKVKVRAADTQQVVQELSDLKRELKKWRSHIDKSKYPMQDVILSQAFVACRLVHFHALYAFTAWLHCIGTRSHSDCLCNIITSGGTSTCQPAICDMPDPEVNLVHGPAKLCDGAP